MLRQVNRRRCLVGASRIASVRCGEASPLSNARGIPAVGRDLARRARSLRIRAPLSSPFGRGPVPAPPSHGLLWEHPCAFFVGSLHGCLLCRNAKGAEACRRKSQIQDSFQIFPRSAAPSRSAALLSVAPQSSLPAAPPIGSGPGRREESPQRTKTTPEAPRRIAARTEDGKKLNLNPGSGAGRRRSRRWPASRRPGPTLRWSWL